MNSAKLLYKGRVLRSRAPANDAGAAAPEDRADPVLDGAERQAAAILAAARAQAETLIAEARQAAEAELASRLLALDRDYRRDVLALQPLLVGIVRRSVQEILDETPEAERAERVVRRALRDLPDRDIVLHCGPADIDDAERAVRAIEASAPGAIRAIALDPHVEPGAWRLDAGGVTLEIGPTAQIAVLTEILSGSLLADGGEPT
ncbi:HrpE/YscL family type III secretion apparatus protein [Alsobacter sp. KACC 23698]|uniref:HrpE/YscL family type III secretion apparatus protein n=1 Tax=Alsobacter sp. KACC 23698 TaxID=3149229 RepID=A0AAU7JCW1_9HYPH